MNKLLKILTQVSIIHLSHLNDVHGQEYLL